MLKKLTFSVLVLLTLTDMSALDNDLAKTPPMGWNSWNTFHCWDINEQLIRDVADSMVSLGLKDAGYEYVVIDDCWQTERGDDGVIIADPAKFPSGMKALADYVHSKGLKFGLYSCVGPNTCAGRPGSYGYEEIDAMTWASWGVDFVKIDWCSSGGLDAKTQYTKMRDALLATGRPILFSICEWGENKPWLWAQNVGNMWRTTYDIVSCFDCNEFFNMGWSKIIEQNVNYAPFAGPGHWNDPDMLEVGTDGLTDTESLTHFVMWCMMAAPLIAGNDVRNMTEYTRSILTAPELIAVNQDTLGIQGTRIKNENNLQIWQKPLSDGSIAVAFYNKSDNTAEMSITLNDLGLEMDTAYIRDLWLQSDMGFIKDTLKHTVESHGVFIAKVKGKRLPVSEVSFDQDTIRMNVGNNAVINANISPANNILRFSVSDAYYVNTGIIGENEYSISAQAAGSCYVAIESSDGYKSDTCYIEISPSNLPSTWKFQDINDYRGAATFEDDTFTLEAAGDDIWGRKDQCGFLYKDTTGNIFISARLNNIENTDPWAKAGIMFRESVAGASSNFTYFQTPAHGINLQWRPEFSEETKSMKTADHDNPVYLKLAKYDSVFYYYISDNGTDWTYKGERVDPSGFEEEYAIGLVVTSHNGSVSNTATFSDICFGPSELRTIPVDTTSINPPDIAKETNVFPNPVKDILNISNSFSGEMKFRIVNVNGQMVAEGILPDKCRQIDCSNFQNGIYFLNLSCNDIMIENNLLFKVN